MRVWLLTVPFGICTIRILGAIVTELFESNGYKTPALKGFARQFFCHIQKFIHVQTRRQDFSVGGGGGGGGVANESIQCGPNRDLNEKKKKKIRSIVRHDHCW